MAIKIGCCEIDDALVFHVPDDVQFVRCRIYRRIDFDRSVGESIRSGGHSSQLLADSLYRMLGVPLNGKNAHAYVSTFGGVPQLLSDAEFEAALERTFPESAARVRAAREREAQRAEQLLRIRPRPGLRALRERNVVVAEQIKENGQPSSDYPPLTGTPRQIAWALDIRSEFALRHPDDPLLKRATRAQYWISNYHWILERPDP